MARGIRSYCVQDFLVAISFEKNRKKQWSRSRIMLAKLMYQISASAHRKAVVHAVGWLNKSSSNYLTVCTTESGKAKYSLSQVPLLLGMAM